MINAASLFFRRIYGNRAGHRLAGETFQRPDQAFVTSLASPISESEDTATIKAPLFDCDARRVGDQRLVGVRSPLIGVFQPQERITRMVQDILSSRSAYIEPTWVSLLRSFAHRICHAVFGDCDLAKGKPPVQMLSSLGSALRAGAGT